MLWFCCGPWGKKCETRSNGLSRAQILSFNWSVCYSFQILHLKNTYILVKFCIRIFQKLFIFVRVYSFTNEYVNVWWFSKMLIMLCTINYLWKNWRWCAMTYKYCTICTCTSTVQYIEKNTILYCYDIGRKVQAKSRQEFNYAKPEEEKWKGMTSGRIDKRDVSQVRERRLSEASGR